MKRYFACAVLRKHGERLAWAQDVYPEELRRHRASLRRDGTVVLGDFASREEAQSVARNYILADTHKNSAGG
jgi:hypothetical protein